MEYSGAGGKLIHEKKPEAKNLVTLSLETVLNKGTKKIQKSPPVYTKTQKREH